MDLRTALIALTASAVASSADAGETTMTCKNPRREHVVTYDDVSKIVVDRAAGASAAYKVTGVTQSGGAIRVEGKAVQEGPDIVASFRSPKSVSYLLGGKVLQKDPCR